MKDFNTTLEQILKTLNTVGFLGKPHRSDFTNSEFIQFQAQISQIAMQGAIQLQELEMKRHQLGIENEKTRQELELATITSTLQNLKLASEAALVCTQAESVRRSTIDNARIQKSQSFVNHFNVTSNAVSANAANLNSGSLLQRMSDKVLSEIDKIDTSDMDSKYTEVLQNILEKSLGFKDIAASKAQVSIIAPKTTLQVGETLTLMGISAYGDNEAEFIIGSGENQITEPSKIYIFKSERAGRVKVTFRAKNNAQKWVSTSITLKIIKDKEKVCKS